MPYSIPGPAILEIQIVGRLHEQTTRTIFHYAKTDQINVADGAAEVLGCLNDFELNTYNTFLPCASPEWSCQYLQGQVVKPTRFRARIITPLVLAGQTGADSLPSGCSCVISTYAETAGRISRGRKYFPGCPTLAEVNSKLNAAQITRMNALADKMKLPLGTGQVTWRPWVGLKPSSLDPVYNQQFLIVDTKSRDIIRYQRRREIAVGE